MEFQKHRFIFSSNYRYNRLVTALIHQCNFPSVTPLIHLYHWDWNLYTNRHSSFRIFMSNSIQPYHRPTNRTIKDNSPPVFSVPVDLCFEATRASQISLLIRPSNPRKQNLRAITRFFPQLWGLDNVVSGRVIEHGRAQFLFPSNEALNLVLRRGPWSFHKWMVAMEAWSPNISNHSPTTIDFWVQIRDIPI